MRILAIETSCDETAISLLDASGGLAKPKFKILKHLVASQVKVHRPFGGVVPNLAKREHLKNLPVLLGKIFPDFKLPACADGSAGRQNPNFKQIPKSKIPKIDLIAVTVGPGLEPALWTGINFAKSLIKADIYADKRGLISENLRRNPRKSAPKLVGVNHLEGHLYSFLLPQRDTKREAQVMKHKLNEVFPAVALIVSGGHTILLLMKNLKTIKKLGETRDDAVGEAFDKVARMLRLPYPGGPELEGLARKGNPQAIEFPRPMLEQKNYDFSFSGLKTAVLYYLRDADGRGSIRRSTQISRNFISENQRSNPRKSADMEDVAASFQRAAIDVLVGKTLRAARAFGANAIMISGGVAANRELRKRFKLEIQKLEKLRNLDLLIPDFRFCTDNASIIGAAGYIALLRKRSRRLEARGNLNFTA